MWPTRSSNGALPDENGPKGFPGPFFGGEPRSGEASLRCLRCGDTPTLLFRARSAPRAMTPTHAWPTFSAWYQLRELPVSWGFALDFSEKSKAKPRPRRRAPQFVARVAGCPALRPKGPPSSHRFYHNDSRGVLEARAVGAAKDRKPLQRASGGGGRQAGRWNTRRLLGPGLESRFLTPRQ
jgi:hypothetical protein